MNLVTLEEYKAFNAMSDNPAQDAKLTLLITSVSSLIKAYLGVPDLEDGTEVTEVFALDYETDTIYLKNYPIQGPITVTETSRITTDSSIHVPLTGNSEFFVNESEGSILRVYTPGGFARWPISPGTVSVTYSTVNTWDEDSTPADLKLAAIELVNYYNKEEYRQSKSVQGTSLVNTLAQDSDFPKHIQVILDRHSTKYS